MTNLTQSRTYKGRVIYPCERAEGSHNGRWVVVTYHRPTGLWFSDELCPHFWTLTAAREYINSACEVPS